MSTRKVWDITQPSDNWERGYAKLAYDYTALRQALATKIEVHYD